MSDAIPWSNTNSVLPIQSIHRSRLVHTVIWQVAFVSIAAYFSQLLIFDEANWYMIDLYDAMVWGIVVTQVFALAIYVSRYRIQTIGNSLAIFFSMGVLSAGLTIAAITFLVVDALVRDQEVWRLFLISGGYCVAVFVFLVSMFLQLRLAIICLQAVRQMFTRKQSRKQSQSDPPTSDMREVNGNSGEKYSIADIFAFTGLAAVSISAYRLVLGMVTDYDALRFLAMFYAASITAFCTYGFIQLNCARVLKILFVMAAIASIAYAEFYLAQQLRSPLLRFGFGGMLLCNAVIALATTMQQWFLARFTRPNVTVQQSLPCLQPGSLLS